MTLSDRIRAIQSKWIMVLGDDAVELGKIAIEVEQIERFADEAVAEAQDHQQTRFRSMGDVQAMVFRNVGDGA